MIEIIISALCIYAVSSLIVNYDGPFGILDRLRNIRFIQGVTDCQACTAFWCTLPFLYFLQPLEALAAFGLVVLAIRFEP